MRSLVQLLVQHVRPTSAAEETAAINMGMRKAVRAIAAVRNQAFQAFVDPFTLTPGTTEYDLGLYDPPVWRPHRLLIGTPPGTVRTIRFRYLALTSPDFEDREAAVAGTFATLVYDILVGKLPGTSVAITATNGTTTVTVASANQFQAGTVITIPGAGPVVTYDGVGMPGTYTGVVTSVAGLVLSCKPTFTAAPSLLVLATPLRRRIMKLVPPVPDAISGRLWYTYSPPNLAVDTDLLDPLISEHRDMVVYYAAAQLLRAVNEADAQRWWEMAQEMRSELMQNMDPLSGQNTEALGTGLDWGDY